jgi:hypothetical protein
MHGKGLDLPCNLRLIRPSELVNAGTILSADFQDWFSPTFNDALQIYVQRQHIPVLRVGYA